jgi:hypothetical protein
MQFASPGGTEEYPEELQSGQPVSEMSTECATFQTQSRTANYWVVISAHAT